MVLIENCLPLFCGKFMVYWGKKHGNNLCTNNALIPPWHVALIPLHRPSAVQTLTLLPIRSYPVSHLIPQAAFSTTSHLPPTIIPCVGGDSAGQVICSEQETLSIWNTWLSIINMLNVITLSLYSDDTPNYIRIYIDYSTYLHRN